MKSSDRVSFLCKLLMPCFIRKKNKMSRVFHIHETQKVIKLLYLFLRQGQISIIVFETAVTPLGSTKKTPQKKKLKINK